ncbi:TolC family protein [Halobacteriovorax sp. GB3]|uniref:TolC family protein n=1 Tax=Halobacteriovorax sp. GB3 TaxID=2719615 RepID=UPI0023603BF7|nr:TolC family protein [Halobacteriovorax sp. GB3]MDD0851528.1 TolC family protein [Halobacteriovorax sp. GB3]
MRSILLGLSLIIGGQVLAQDLVLDEKAVIDLALKRNEAIGISKAELEIAKKKVDSAYSNLFPTMSASAILQKSKISGNISGSSDNWVDTGSLQVTQPLYTFGKISTAIDIAKVSKGLSRDKQLATKAEIENVSKKLFYSVLYAKELVKITNDSYQNALKNKQTLERRVSYGRISRNDNLKMQADLASRMPRLVDAKKNFELNKFELKNFLALESDFKVSGDLSNNQLEKKESPKSDSIDEIADVKILKKSLEISDLSVELSKAQRLPDLGAFASFSPTHLRNDAFGSEVANKEESAVGLSLTFDWPFGGSKNDAVEIKKIEKRVAALRLQEGKRSIKTQIDKINVQLESLKMKLDSEKRAVKLAESSYKVALGAFATGAVSQLQLNDSELLLTQNKLSLAGTLFEYMSVLSDLERLLVKGER